jgi:Archaeal/vacuolar-type H+-ATPase subunit I
MKLISIIGLMQDLGEVIRICGKFEAFQPDNVFSFYSNTENFVPVSEESMYAKLINRLSEIAKPAGWKLKIVDVSDFDADDSQIVEYVDYISDKMRELTREEKRLVEESKKYKAEINKLEKFKGLHVKINDLMDCEYVEVRFGKLPKESLEKISLYSADESILFFPCGNDNSYCWGIYFAPIEKLDEVDRIFSNLYFERIRIESFDGTVDQKIEKFQTEFRKTSDEIFLLKKRMDLLWEQQKGQCLRVYSKLKEMETFSEIRKFAARYNESFILVGWFPADKEREFGNKLSEVNGVEYSTEAGKNILGHSPPVQLKNKKIFRPFEFFVDTYGLPSYDEIDPTIFVSITYTLLFGIMFADLGQGLMVSIVGYLMWKLKKMRLGKPLISCGISSAIFGTIFGSVFGYEHLLDPFYKTVFGLEGKPIEVMDSGATNTIIYSAVGIGIVLLIFTMILNIYSLIRRHKYGDAVFGQNGISGLIFYVSAVISLLDMMALHLNFVNPINIVLFIGLPLVLIMFSEILGPMLDGKEDWMPDSWGNYLAQSVFELFEVVLSYVTNTMSFLRVGAFVLVHAGMMMVVFTIAEMLGGSGYFIAVVIGNVFVMCLEALLAGIQVMRLEFYEMFSRFFEGQGRPFIPVKLKRQI